MLGVRTARILSVVMFSMCVFLVSGCVFRSSRDVDLSRFMLDMDSESGNEVNAGLDAPEPPSLELPPPPKVVKSSEKKGVITIQPDCLLQVKVKEDKSFDGTYPVNDIGAAELPHIGPIILYNMTEKEAAGKIKEQLENRYFRNATVTVKILRPSYDKIMVTGVVNRAGLVRIGSGDSISLNDALRRAGGLRVSVKGCKVNIVRDGLRYAIPQAIEGEEHSLVTKEGKPGVPDVSLNNNDIVYVFSDMEQVAPEAGSKRIYIVGKGLASPRMLSFSAAEPCTMLHLLLKMSGLPDYADPKRIEIRRLDAEGKEKVIKVNAEEILKEGNPDKDVPLENGDRVIVPARKIYLFD
ncbi:polysaccharide biosynthesis/export family protein [Verrucomicrobiota bacterium]